MELVPQLLEELGTGRCFLRIAKYTDQRMTGRRESSSDNSDVTRASNKNTPECIRPDLNKSISEIKTESLALGQGVGRSQQIGPYKLLQEIGQGGMGSVWMAEQEQPVRRRVAVKLIKGSMTDKQIIARFEAERQALAMMDHQNIATVLDAGTTDAGTPYFVMELVNGIPINHYCDRNKLDPDQRLRLFVQVCKAIQHAHQKGIIHRDLKPSNVLVQLRDGEPIAKVIDFGLAKALQHQTKLTDKTLFTEFGRVVGTLQYMSPEQASMDAMNVDTRTDIYSLGVMLYELLVGSTPVEKETLKKNALLHVLEVIREKEPLKPSLRLSSAREKLSKISELRQIQPGKLQQILRGELDWIVMKALEKDRTRRYESASDFAQDITNYLSGDSVRARPPSTWYQLQKFARKNKGLVASLAIISALLIAAVGVSSWFAFQANVARNKESEQRQIAESKANEVSKERDRANENEALAKREAKRFRDSDAAGKFQLAVARWEASRAEEARRLLDEIPEKYRKFEWHFSKRQFSGSDITCYGHRLAIGGVAFSPDGQRIASGSWDHTIKLWDATSGAELQTLSGHTDQVGCLAFSPSGQRIASGGADKSIKVWDANSGAVLQTLNGHLGVVCSLAFTSDGQRIASGSTDKSIKVWDATSGAEIHTLGGHAGEVVCVVFSPDGQRIASSSTDGTIKLWDSSSGKELQTFRGQNEPNGKVNSPVSSVAFSPDGQRIASGDWNNTVKVWDTASGAELQTMRGHTSMVSSVAFSPDGQRIASGSSDNTIKVWDAFNGIKLNTFSGHTAGVESVAFSPDGQRIASGSWDHTIKVWDAVSGAKQLALFGHADAVMCLAFSPDGQRIAGGSWSKIVKLWDATSGEELQTFGGHDDAVKIVTFSPDGQRIASGSNDYTIKIWDAASGTELHTLTGHSHYINCVTFSPDGQRIASCSEDNTVKIWDAASGAELHTLSGHNGRISGVVFFPDGRRLASGSYDKTIKVWDVASGAELQTFRGHSRVIESVAFSPDGQRIVSSSYDNTIKYWDPARGSVQKTLNLGNGPDAGLVFSPDHQRIASGRFDGTIKFWDATSGAELQTFRGHTGAVYSVAFSPENQQIASGSKDNTIRIWNGASESECQTLRGHTGRVVSAVFSPDGKQIYSTSENEKLVWNANTRTVDSGADWLVTNPQQRKSPDRRWLVTSAGSNVFLIDLEYKNTPRERGYRVAKARFNPWWQREQAQKAIADKKWFAATFHFALLLKNDPSQAELHDKLHKAHEELVKGFKSTEETNVNDILPAVVKEALKLPRGTSR